MFSGMCFYRLTFLGCFSCICLQQRPTHVPKFENWNTGYTSYFEGARVVRGAKPGHEEQSNKEDEDIRCQIFGNKPRAEGTFPPSTTGQKSQGGNI